MILDERINYLEQGLIVWLNRLQSCLVFPLQRAVERQLNEWVKINFQIVGWLVLCSLEEMFGYTEWLL